MLDKKIIVIGGNGMVGKQIKFALRLNHKQLDITDPDSIELAILKYKPRIIIHLAALTDMLTCENNPNLAKTVNVNGTKNLAKACKKHNIKLVYLSTCAVFDGKKRTPYSEADTPKPINVYGRTKLQAEQEIKKILPDALIIRTGWLFGGGKSIDKKFVQKTINRLNKLKSIKATADRYGSPTYIPDLLKVLQNLMKKNSLGIFHVVNSGQASYFEIAKKISDLKKINPTIIPVKASEVEPKILKRGTMEALTSKKIKLRSWQSALKKYLTFK